MHWFLFVAFVLAMGCSEQNSETDPTAGNNGGKSDIPDDVDSGGLSDVLESLQFSPNDVPADSNLLFAYLQAANYESLARHPEREDDPASFHGPSDVYFNALLADSFTNGTGEHPEGSAAVKVLFDSLEAVEPSGWAVTIKIQTPSGLDWWWYENNNTTTNTPKQAKTGGTCARCHSAGDDGIFTKFPFE